MTSTVTSTVANTESPEDVANFFNTFIFNLQSIWFNTSEVHEVPTILSTTLPPGVKVPKKKKQDAWCEGNVHDTVDNILFYKIILVPALICIAILAFNTKRKYYRLNLLRGRPGLCHPVNVLQGQDNRLPLVAAFIFLGWIMLQFITNGKCNQPFYQWEKYPMIEPFYKLASYIVFAFIFYPIFASLTQDSKIGYAVGTVYCWTFCGVLLTDSYQQIGTINPLIPYREIRIIIGFRLIPQIVCAIYLCIIFPYRLIMRLFYRYVKKYQKNRNIRIAEASQIKYVRELFRRHKKPIAEPTFKEKVKKWFYVPMPGFKYSTGMLAAFSMSTVFMYMMALIVLRKFYTFVEFKKRLLKKPHTYLTLMKNPIIKFIAGMLEEQPVDIAKRITAEGEFWMQVIEGCLYTSLTAIFVWGMVCLLLTLRSYRRHTLEIRRGAPRDFSQEHSPASIVISAVKYVGYQVAYSLWGFIIQLAGIGGGFTLGVMFLSFLIRYDLFEEFLLWLIRKFWCGIVTLIIIKVTQTLMARYLFLMKGDDGEKVLALDNRRLFFNFHYFAIFGNIALGLISAILRVIKGAVFGLLCLPRLDMSTMSRFFERFDAGHKAYVDMLYLEEIYRNPVMLAFVGILQQPKALTRKTEFVQANVMAFITGKVHTPTHREETPGFKRARIRWQTALTLINNEVLILERKKWLKDILKPKPVKKPSIFARAFASCKNCCKNCCCKSNPEVSDNNIITDKTVSASANFSNNPISDNSVSDIDKHTVCTVRIE